MITNTSSFDTLSSNVQALPLEIQKHIQSYVPTMVDHASRNKLYNELQAETDQKKGLYGENLILKGLLLCDQLFEAEQNWNFRKIELENEIATDSLPMQHWYNPVPTLFTNAINNPKGKSLKALNMLYYTNYGAAEALLKLTDIKLNKTSILDLGSQFKENSERINKLIQKTLQQRNTEQTIYNVCGGKNKFHDLKILLWKGVKNFERYTSLKKIHEGETVMRGLDSTDRPFIAISMCGQKFSSDYNENIITVIQQIDSEDPTKWFNHGTHGGLLYNSRGGSLSRLGIQTGETGPFSILGKDSMEYDTHCYVEHRKRDTRIDNLFPTLQKLLTNGSCSYDYKIEDVKKYYETMNFSYKTENHPPAEFKLKEQV